MATLEDVMKRLDEIGRKLEETNRAIAALKAAPQALSAARGSGQIAPAPDADLDGQYGDPAVKFSPKKWDGPDYKGYSFSATEPAFLDVLAEALAWSADHPKPGKEKYAAYDRKDAARALGWAQRLRRQGVAEPPPDDYDRGPTYGGGYRYPTGNGSSGGARPPAPPVDAGGRPPPDDDGYGAGGPDSDIPFISCRGMW